MVIKKELGTLLCPPKEFSCYKLSLFYNIGRAGTLGLLLTFIPLLVQKGFLFCFYLITKIKADMRMTVSEENTT